MTQCSQNYQEDDYPELLRSEIEAAIAKLKKRKSPGVDNIPAEEIQAAGSVGLDIVLFELCRQIWNTECFPQNWKKSVIVPIHKKSDRLCCDNYKGISLLHHCEKVIASVILQRIRTRTEELLSETQAGFRARRSTIDQLFTLRRLSEKYAEFGKHLICVLH